MFQGGSLWTGLIEGGIYQFNDTRALNNGEQNRQEYAKHTTKNVIGAVGTMAGVEYGALLGTTVMPGVGTVVGAVIGAAAGDRLGRLVGEQAGNAIFSRMITGVNQGQTTDNPQVAYNH